ncbi:MAG: alanine--tRNA ligase-related protein, partial [Spirochaetota bacterium]|nr:alanine--tRNA ligase-related protein [Spirochaetota bacterium]
ENFFNTLEEGSVYLENIILKCKEQGLKEISGKDAFKLYDSMGFPIDLTEDIAAERGMTVNLNEYDSLMNEQKERGRLAWKGEVQSIPDSIINQKLKTEYVGDETKSCESNILFILKKNEDNKVIDSSIEKDNIIIICDKTPFYAESGGQIGDVGIIQHKENHCQVIDTHKYNDLILHHCIVTKGKFKKGDNITLSVDDIKKKSTASNHSATHLLQKALQKILGDHVRQLGSLVNDEKLRFDFSHFNPLTQNEIILIENEVNSMIQMNIPTQIKKMDKEEALKQGALAFFGDKYDHKVRTVQIGESFELCGGTHVQRSGDIACFKIISESSISSGTRRIEAITGEKAINLFQDVYKLIKNLELLFNTQSSQILIKVNSIIEKNKTLEKEIKELKMKTAISNIDDLIEKNLHPFNDINFISFALTDKDINELRKINDEIKGKYKKLLTLLFSEKDGKTFYLSTISKDISNTKIKANDIIKKVSELLNGKGGGKEDRAQGTCESGKNLDETIIKMISYIKSLV